VITQSEILALFANNSPGKFGLGNLTYRTTCLQSPGSCDRIAISRGRNRSRVEPEKQVFSQSTARSTPADNGGGTLHKCHELATADRKKDAALADLVSDSLLVSDGHVYDASRFSPLSTLSPANSYITPRVTDARKTEAPPCLARDKMSPATSPGTGLARRDNSGGNNLPMNTIYNNSDCRARAHGRGKGKTFDEQRAMNDTKIKKASEPWESHALRGGKAFGSWSSLTRRMECGAVLEVVTGSASAAFGRGR